MHVNFIKKKKIFGASFACADIDFEFLFPILENLSRVKSSPPSHRLQLGQKLTRCYVKEGQTNIQIQIFNISMNTGHRQKKYP